MSESHWPLVTAAVHQLGAFVEEASAHHMRFRVDAVSIDLRPEPQLGPVDGLQALAELGEVAQPLRESCFTGLLSANLELFRTSRSTVGIDEAGRVVFATRLPSPEGASYAEFDHALQAFCACVADMRREFVALAGSA